MPLFSPLMAEFNRYDLELMDFLELFEDPEREKQYMNTYIDDDFNEEWDKLNNDDVDIEDESEWIEVKEDE